MALVVGTLLAVAFKRQGPQDQFTISSEKIPNAPLPEWWMAAHPNHPDTVAQRAAEADGNQETSDGTAGEAGTSTGTLPPLSRLRRRPATELNC